MNTKLLELGRRDQLAAQVMGRSFVGSYGPPMFKDDMGIRIKKDDFRYRAVGGSLGKEFYDCSVINR